MKHILNNLSEEEKNSIREQHTGGMKVMTENFNKLLNSKLGDAKPLIKESTLSEQGFHPVEGKLDDEERLNQLLDFVRKNDWTQKNVLGNKFAKYVEDGGSIWEKNGKVLIISPTKNYFYSEMKLNGPFNLSQMSKYIK